MALSQRDVKGLVAYSGVAHAGYILVGVVAANEAGAAGVSSFTSSLTPS